MSTEDKLARSIASTLNRSNSGGSGKIAHFLNDNDSPTNVSRFVPTGSTVLDMLISNKPDGGLPVGKIVEFYGLPACIHPSTKIDVRVDGNHKTCSAAKIQGLLDQSSLVEVPTKNDEWTQVTDFVHKGIQKSYRVITDSGDSIVVSENHLFFTNQEWVYTKDLDPHQHQIMSQDGLVDIAVIESAGMQPTVDITVDHPDQCYFAQNMLHHNTGKSLIASHVLAHTQKMGGLAVYIDTESAAKPEFLETIGIDLNNLVYIAQNRAEHIFAVIEKCIQKVKKEDSDRFITVVVDSIAGMTTENEDSADYAKEGYATDKAIILSKAMRKINKMIGSEQVLLLFTNQVRHSMNMYGPEYTTPGGQAVPFHSSVRVHLRKAKTIAKTISGKKQQVGAKLRPKVEKNRLAPSGRSCEFDLFFNTGIDDVGSWWDVLKEHQWINHKSRGWYLIVGEKDDDGNPISWWAGQGQETTDDKDDARNVQEGSFNDYAKEDPEFRKFLRDRLENSILVTYNQDWTGDDDLEYTEDDTTTVSDQDS